MGGIRCTGGHGSPVPLHFPFRPILCPNHPPYPTFYIGVGAGPIASGAATFSILGATAAGGYAPTQLLDGAPQGGLAQPHSMAYYTLDLAGTEGSAGGFDAWVAPVSGTCEVYVAAATTRGAALLFPTPFCRLTDPSSGHCTQWGATPGSYNWTSVGGATAGLVSVLPGTFQQPTLLLPVIVVAVLATSPDAPVTAAPPPPSSFSVTAGTGARLLQLQGGVPAPGAVSATGQAGMTKVYAYYPTLVAADVAISVDVSTGRLEVYAAEFAVGAPSLRPSPTNNQWNSTGQNTRAVRSRVLRIPWAQLSPACQAAVAASTGGCGIAIAVVGTSMMAPMQAAYTIVAAAAGSPSQPTTLPNGATEAVSLPPLGCAYLLSRAPLAGSTTAAFVTVDNLVGTTVLYVNVGEGRGGFGSQKIQTPTTLGPTTLTTWLWMRGGMSASLPASIHPQICTLRCAQI